MSFSGRNACKCARYESDAYFGSYRRSRKPVREWVVVQRRQNRSTFPGQNGRIEKSAWSHVLCLTCGVHWRTQAKYVDRLPDLSQDGRELCRMKLHEGMRASAALLVELKSNVRKVHLSRGSQHSVAELRKRLQSRQVKR